MRIETLYQLDPTEAVQRWLCRPELDPLMEAASIAGEGWFLLLMMFVLAWKGSGDRGEVQRSALRGLVVLAVTGALVLACKRTGSSGSLRPVETGVDELDRAKHSSRILGEVAMLDRFCASRRGNRERSP